MWNILNPVLNVRLQNFWVPLPGLWCALASVGQSLARVKLQGPAPLAADISSHEKADLGGSKLTCSTLWIVDQSSPDLFRRTREELFPIACLSDFGYLVSSGDIRDQIWKLCKIAPNFACFWPQNFVADGPRIFGLAL